GEGSWLWDADGHRYLDFGSGIAVTNTGHCHPKVVAAVTEQAATLIHTSVVCHPTGMIRLAERLAALVPYLAEPQVFFCNSGAGLAGRAAGTLRPPRHPAGLRRGADGRRADGPALRRRDVRGHPRRDPLRQGHRLGAPAGWDHRPPVGDGPVADRRPRLDLRREPGVVRRGAGHPRSARRGGLLRAGPPPWPSGPRAPRRRYRPGGRGA